jgi:hypothetical protein
MYHLKFDEQSNAADWIEAFQVLGDDGGVSDIYADGWAVTVKVAAIPPSMRGAANYGLLANPILTASTDDGSVIVSADDALQWTFTALQMSQLTPGAYLVGCLATKANNPTVQLFLGTLPVIQGL